MDILSTIVPKSDQLGADDLIGRDLTITITRVTLDTTAEQPVTLYFEDDWGRPYKPGKSMRRVLVHCWGPDASVYTGRSLTIYRDPDVKFGGMEVGGIRIRSMTHIAKRQVIPLTATRGNKRPFVVDRLQMEAPAKATTKLAEPVGGGFTSPPHDDDGVLLDDDAPGDPAEPGGHEDVQWIVRELVGIASEAKLAKFQRSAELKERLSGLLPDENRQVAIAMHAAMRRLAPKPEDATTVTDAP